LLSNHWHHHSRFYIALALALLAAAAGTYLHWPVPGALAGDVFFLAYLIGCLLLAARLSNRDLDKRADIEDEGMLLVFVITLAAVAFACVDIFTALNRKDALSTIPLIITFAGAPLGWFMLHTVMTFHYANLFYRCDDNGNKPPLEFPGDKNEPGVVEFFYYSFVIGMTTQVSDVQVKTTRLRRTTLLHSIVSFFFNTVLIALSVNAVVALAS
jgi:uncharacterized membrane protein